MPRRRDIKSVLHNFLGTFISRYSDFDGYWVFGFLVEDMIEVNIDLLAPNAASDTHSPMAFTLRLASQKFAEQIIKAGLPKNWCRDARLIISKSPEPILGVVNYRPSSGYNLLFHVKATTDSGRTFEYRTSAFVAPHNPKIESKSIRLQ